METKLLFFSSFINFYYYVSFVTPLPASLWNILMNWIVLSIKMLLNQLTLKRARKSFPDTCKEFVTQEHAWSMCFWCCHERRFSLFFSLPNKIYVFYYSYENVRKRRIMRVLLNKASYISLFSMPARGAKQRISLTWPNSGIKMLFVGRWYVSALFHFRK